LTQIFDNYDPVRVNKMDIFEIMNNDFLDCNKYRQKNATFLSRKKSFIYKEKLIYKMGIKVFENSP